MCRVVLSAAKAYYLSLDKTKRRLKRIDRPASGIFGTHPTHPWGAFRTLLKVLFNLFKLGGRFHRKVRQGSPTGFPRFRGIRPVNRSALSERTLVETYGSALLLRTDRLTPKEEGFCGAVPPDRFPFWKGRRHALRKSFPSLREVDFPSNWA